MNEQTPLAVHTGETVLTNARLVLPDRVVPGTLVIRDEQIGDIDTGASGVPGAVDCHGDYLAPGLIELHTDNLERHMQPRPGVKWPLRPAVIAHDAELAGVGITTVFDALRIGSILSSRSRYGKYARGMASEIIAMRALGVLRISHFIHLRAEICSETLIEELNEFTPDDRIGIVSLMDHTPGQRQFADPRQHRIYLSGKYGMSDADIDAHFDDLLGLRAKYGDAQEAHAIKRARELGAVLASHDDTTLDHVATSASHGIRLAEFPTTQAAASACKDAQIAVMMGAPNLLRGGSHSGNVAAATLFQQGCLDILSSDYAPSSLLAAAVRLGQETGNMADGVHRVTAAPAAAAGLVDRGQLRTGLRADLVRFAEFGGAPVTRGVWVRGARVA